MSSRENETSPEAASDGAEPSTSAATASVAAPASAEASSAEPVPSAEASSAEPAPSAAGAETDTRVKTKKKKKRPAAEPSVIPERPERDARGRDRPAFLLRFPQDAELEGLMQAFEAGNYAKVREYAPRLAERSESPQVKAAAEELLRRIEPDPLVKVLLAIAIGLFFAVVGFVYYSQ